MSFEFSEALIAELTRLSIEGDQWFKNFTFEVDLSLFLFPRHEILYWSKKIHQNSLKEEGREVLRIIQCYVTYEGIFSSVHA